MRRSQAVCLLGAVTIAIGGSLGSAEAGEPAEPPIQLVIGPSAEAAARDAGVDLRALLTGAAAEIYARLPRGRRVRVEVRVDPNHQQVIPEIGVGAYFTGRGVRIFVERPLRPGTAAWLPATMAHELHHASRFALRPSTFGATLGQVLVSEGLADSFADEIFPATPPQPWDRGLSAKQEASLWKKAKPLLWKTGGYDGGSWFFGGSGMPRWAGYRLGHLIAGSYLRYGWGASDAVGVDARVVIENYARARAGG